MYNEEIISGMLVTVKFLGPTNNKGSRYKATLARGTEPEHQFNATVSSSYSGEDDYLTACLIVLQKFEKWRNTDREEKFSPLRPCAKGYDNKTGNYSFVCI